MEIYLMTYEKRRESVADPPKSPEVRNHLSLPESIRTRIAELETENLRLQRLVSELLLKNQLLREAPGSH
jgi:hypothetical protein